MEIKKELFWGLGITFLAIVLSVYYILSFKSVSGQSLKTTTVSSNVTLTTVEIAKHNQTSDCWFIVDHKVYDLTSYLNLHPGGADRIISYCGKDATQVYKTKDGQGNHSSAANQDLANLYIGDLNGAVQATPNPTVINSLSPRKEREREGRDD